MGTPLDERAPSQSSQEIEKLVAADGAGASDCDDGGQIQDALSGQQAGGNEAGLALQHAAHEEGWVAGGSQQALDVQGLDVLAGVGNHATVGCQWKLCRCSINASLFPNWMRVGLNSG
jgi:hypothetical protein